MPPNISGFYCGCHGYLNPLNCNCTLGVDIFRVGLTYVPTDILILNGSFR